MKTKFLKSNISKVNDLDQLPSRFNSHRAESHYLRQSWCDVKNVISIIIYTSESIIIFLELVYCYMVTNQVICNRSPSITHVRRRISVRWLLHDFQNADDRFSEFQLGGRSLLVLLDQMMDSEVSLLQRCNTDMLYSSKTITSEIANVYKISNRYLSTC